MNKFLSFIKAAPITVASIVVALLCIAALVFITMQGTAFTQDLEDREAAIAKIRALFQTRVTIPPETADGPPRSTSIVVNTTAIEKLEKAFGLMDEEFREIFRLAVLINKDRHLVLLDGLFPTVDSSALPFQAQDKYLASYNAMLGPHTPEPLLPRLNAGLAVTKAELEQEVEATTREFLRSSLEASTEDRLSDEQRARLDALKRQAVLRTLNSRAESIHLYVDSLEPRNANFPFEIGGWATQSDQPRVWQVWEGQRMLWIQQDIAKAIADANRTSDPRANVTTAPVKKLIGIDVLGGYVGIHHQGGLASGTIPDDPTTRILTAPENIDLGSADSPLPNNFAVSPTGRRSNALYDVAHVKLRAHVDYQQLPAFFNSLGNVNFMTVLHVEMTQVDEYEMLRQGYVYGSGDVVEVTMLIETIWLRQWIEPLMPSAVKTYMGVNQPNTRN